MFLDCSDLQFKIDVAGMCVHKNLIFIVVLANKRDKIYLFFHK